MTPPPPLAAGRSPNAELSRGRSIWALAVLCAGVGLVTAALTALYASGPELARAIGASQTELTWIIDAYTLVMAGLLLPAGALGDRFGRKGVLVAGLALFVVVSTALCFVESPSALIGLRALLGVAAALILPSTLSLITSTFPPSFRDTAVGIWTASFTIAGGVAILLTGILLEFFSWHSAFWSVAAGSAVILLASLTVPTSREEHPPPIDVPGSIAAMVSIFALVYGLIQAGLDGWTSPRIVGSIALGLVAAAAFAAIQLRRRDPLLDVRLFRIRAFGVSAFTVTVCFAAVYGLFFLCMQYQQYVLGYSALQATGPIAGMGVPVVSISLASAWLTRRLGLRIVVSAGCFLAATAFALMLRTGTGTAYWEMFVIFFAMGTGVGLNMAPCTTAIINNVSMAKQGVAASVNHTTREVGTALGVALFGGLLSASYADEVAAATATLPDPAREASRESVAGALEVGAQAGGPAGAALTDAAQSAFVVATHEAALVMVFVMAAAGVIAALWAPSKALFLGAAPAGAEPEPGPAPPASPRVEPPASPWPAIPGFGPVGQAAGLARLGASLSFRTAVWTGTATARAGDRAVRAVVSGRPQAELVRRARRRLPL